MLNKSFSLSVKKQIKSYNKIINVDSDKSISIRSFLLSSVSHNISHLNNILESEDVLSAINCLKKLGVKIKKIQSKRYLVYGKGLGSLSAKKNTVLNFGNSGTLARLLIGLLSTNPEIHVKVKGDHSLNQRNMAKLIDIMNEFGATFKPKKNTYLPLTLISSEMPVGINYKAGVSAQLKSAAILAGLNSYGVTNVHEDYCSRNHTENMLLQNSKLINVKKNKNGTTNIKIFGKESLKSLNINVPGDPSSAAFFTALTLINKNASLVIKNVGLNIRRIGFYNLLKKHGAKIKFKRVKKINNDLIGDIVVKSSKLRPIKAGLHYYPSTTDEYPILFVIASLIPGLSIFKGLTELANKESNRIEEMKKILNQVGIKCKSTKSEMRIRGVKKIKKNNKVIRVPNLGDHRICMSTVIFSLLTGINSEIKNFETVRTSSPSFLNIIKLLGGKYEIKKKR